MRIAFLGPSYPWRGGIAKFAQNLGIKCQDFGHEIMMFTFVHQYPGLLFPGSNQLETIPDKSNLPTQKVLTPYNPITWLSTIHEIKNWKPDVLIISYWIPFMAPACGFIARRLAHTKIVYLLHNIDFHEKWPGGEQLTRYALKPASILVTLSDVTTKALGRLFKQKCHALIFPLFHPVYEQYRSIGKQGTERHNRMLFFGFVKYYKGLDLLIEAMSLLQDKLPELKLVIAGDVYGDKKPYLDQIGQAGLQTKVETHFEYIDDDCVSDYFSDIDVCVIPYRSATQSGVVQLSFAFEIPVIATRVGGLEETVIDGVNGLLVPPCDAKALADAIYRFYSHDYSDAFSAQIKADNAQHTWEQFTRLLLEKLQ